jgi:DNA-binding Lrp family transcriptional regulator
LPILILGGGIAPNNGQYAFIDVHYLYFVELTRTTLDELDMKILNSLSRNCRTSYSSVGNQIGLTAKSVKARVKKMQSSGVIDSFLVKVNPLVFNYSKFCLLIVRNNKADEKHIERSLSLLGDIFDRVDGLGNISIFLLAIKKEAEEKLKLLVDLVGQDLIQNQTIAFPSVREQPTYTDFKIMRCLLANPRMEISDIAEKISISSKTVARRLEKMIENHVLDFTIHCNPKAIWGYIVSVVSANTEKGSYRKVLEKSYVDLKDSFFLYSPALTQQDVIYWVFCSKDVFVLDSIMRRIESYPGVRKVDVFTPTRMEYHQEVIIKEIGRKLDERKRTLEAKEIPNAVA